MNAALLLDHYARIADAPNAIARLRRFVLDLAVRGKLVEQDAADEPASELLVRISTERARLVKSGEAQKSKDLADAADDADFDLPPTWAWTRLGSITSYIQRGKSPKYAEADGVPVISQKCVQWSGLNLGAARLITRQSLEAYEDIRFLRDGDLLWNSTGTGTIGRIIRLDGPPEHLVCDSHVTVVRCLGANPEYVRIWLRSDHVYGTIEGRAAGSTNQVELTAQMALGQVVPLPPLAEQHRIVAKVDELMALCDQLEAARVSREAARDTFTLSTLAKLNTPDPETFGQDARFALANVAPLTTRPNQIKQLRQTVLRLALAGRLTEQDPADDPASNLLAAIEKRRSSLLQSGYPNATEARTQQRKVAEQALPNELAALPHGWEYATLQQCALMVIDCKNKTAPYTSDGVRLIRTTNVRDGKLNSIDQRYVSLATYEVWSARAKPEPGDILITREAPMGEVCLIPPHTTICLGQRMMLARLVPDTISPRFMLYSLMDPDLMDRVQDKPIGMTVQHLRVGGVETLVVPLPPLAEQHRIVTKVDELMALCDHLETSLTTGEQTRSRLLESVLHHALEPA